jgi:hypothetical protein
VAKGPGFGGPASIARLTPVALKVSEEVRLKRLVKGAIYKPDARQLQLPLVRADQIADGIVLLLRQLVPPPEPLDGDGAPRTTEAEPAASAR